MVTAIGQPTLLARTKLGRKHYQMNLRHVIHIPKGLGRKPDALRPYVREYVEALEIYVQENPFQFLNFFDMWAPPDLPDE